MKNVRLLHDSHGRAHLACRNCATQVELDRDADLPAQLATFLDAHERPHALERCAS